MTLQDQLISMIPVVIGFLLGYGGSLFKRYLEKREKI